MRGELLAQPFQQRVAQQLAGAGIVGQFVGAAEADDGFVAFSFVREQLAAERQGFRVVGIGGQPAGDFFA